MSSRKAVVLWFTVAVVLSVGLGVIIACEATVDKHTALQVNDIGTNDESTLESEFVTATDIDDLMDPWTVNFTDIAEDLENYENPLIDNNSGTFPFGSESESESNSKQERGSESNPGQGGESGAKEDSDNTEDESESESESKQGTGSGQGSNSDSKSKQGHGSGSNPGQGSKPEPQKEDSDDTESESDSEAESGENSDNSEQESEPESEPEPGSDPDDNDSEPEPDPESDQESESESESGSESEPEGNPDDTESESEDQSESQSGSDQDPDSGSESEPEEEEDTDDTESDQEPESEQEPEPESGSESEPEEDSEETASGSDQDSQPEESSSDTESSPESTGPSSESSSGSDGSDSAETAVTTTETADSVRIHVDNANGESIVQSFELAGPSETDPAISLSTLEIDPADREEFEMTVARPTSDPGGSPAVPHGEALAYVDLEVEPDTNGTTTLSFEADPATIPDGSGTDDIEVLRSADGEWTADGVTHDVDEEQHRVTLSEASTIAVIALEPGHVEIVDADVPADWVRAGYETKVSATVRNAGDRPETDTLAVSMDGEPVAERNVSLAPDETTDVEIAFEPTDSGTVTLNGAEIGTITVSNGNDEDENDAAAGPATTEDMSGFGAVSIVLALLVAALMVRFKH